MTPDTYLPLLSCPSYNPFFLPLFSVAMTVHGGTRQRLRLEAGPLRESRWGGRGAGRRVFGGDAAAATSLNNNHRY